MDVFARRKAAQQAKYSSAPVSDVERVLALPRSPLVPPLDLARKLRPGQTGIALRPVQEQALAVLAASGGLLGAIGVGHGKSLIALLAGVAIDAEAVVVLVSPATVPYMESILADLQTRYYMPVTRVVSWGRLSAQDSNAMLTDWSVFFEGKRGLLVADEAHFARNSAAARTRRLRVWLEYHPEVRFAALSGTLTTRRLSDFAWLAQRALGAQSPVPAGDLGATWDRVLANDLQSPADFAAVRPLLQWAGCQDVPKNVGQVLTDEQQLLVQRAFGLRLSTAPGVVLTTGASCDASLYLCGLPTPVHSFAGLRRQAEDIARTYIDPAGVELADDTEAARTAKRLSLGYYYQWFWRDGPDYEWLERRQAWARKCRWLLEQYGRPGFDTRGLVEQSARQAIAGGESVTGWLQVYADWAAIADRVKPDKRATWISDEPLRLIVDWATQYQPCIIWYDEEAIADRLEYLGVPVVRAGQAVGPAPRGPVGLSVTAHGGTGLNLQDRWSRQVFACVPANGSAWEQVLGRTHRQGQQADEVWAWVPQWTAPLRQALSKARQDAAWIEASTGNQQKLLLATVLDTCPMVGRVTCK